MPIVRGHVDADGNFPVSFSKDELHEFGREVFLGETVVRCSMSLLMELYVRHRLRKDCYNIIDEINDLERGDKRSRTKTADQFKYPPLKGLWKKHYVPYGILSMAKNIGNGFGRKGKNLKRRIEQIFQDAGEGAYIEDVIGYLAEAVTNFYSERADQRSLTGQWIVFAKHENMNYYLCLAHHKEDNDAIYERLKKNCFPEFPFLRQGGMSLEG